MSIAIADFEEESFSGIKNGLEEVAQVIKIIPTLAADCKIAEEDLLKLIEMAEVFANPF